MFLSRPVDKIGTVSSQSDSPGLSRGLDGADSILMPGQTCQIGPTVGLIGTKLDKFEKFLRSYSET